MKDKIKAAKERLHKVYKDGEEYELKLLKELETELEHELNDRQKRIKLNKLKIDYAKFMKMEKNLSWKCLRGCAKIYLKDKH